MTSSVFLQLILINIFTLNLWLELTSRGEVLAPLALKGRRGAAVILGASGVHLVAILWAWGASESSFTFPASPLLTFWEEYVIPVTAAGAALTIMIVFGKTLFSPRRGNAA